MKKEEGETMKNYIPIQHPDRDQLQKAEYLLDS